LASAEKVPLSHNIKIFASIPNDTKCCDIFVKLTTLGEGGAHGFIRISVFKCMSVNYNSSHMAKFSCLSIIITPPTRINSVCSGLNLLDM